MSNGRCGSKKCLPHRRTGIRCVNRSLAFFLADPAPKREDRTPCAGLKRLTRTDSSRHFGRMLQSIVLRYVTLNPRPVNLDLEYRFGNKLTESLLSALGFLGKVAREQPFENMGKPRLNIHDRMRKLGLAAIERRHLGTWRCHLP